MSPHTEYSKQAELALAAYGNFTSNVPTLEELDDAGFSIAQANAFILKYEVVDQHSDNSGLSATVFLDNNTGETYLAIRGTEITDPGDLFAGLSIAAFGTTVLQPQYASLKNQVQAWLDGGILPQSFSVTGHSLGGFLATGLVDDPAFVNNVSHAYLYNAPGVGGVVGSFADILLGFLGLSPATDTSKISNIEAATGASPIAGLGFDVAPLIDIIIEDQTNPDVTNSPTSKNHNQQVLTDTLAVYSFSSFRVHF